MTSQSPFVHDNAKDDLLVLVDGFDRQTGTATKERAHCEGLLHRAFSVVFVREGTMGPELLLSQRALHKYHSGGLWANSCCSHPRAGEDLLEAAARRVREELGTQVKQLQEIGSFVYRAQFDNDLVEYEYDHVLLGTCIEDISPNPNEVAAIRWVSLDALASELAEHPKHFAPWAFTVLSLTLNSIRELSPLPANKAE